MLLTLAFWGVVSTFFAFLLGVFFLNKNFPKIRATYSAFLGFMYVIYIISLLVAIVKCADINSLYFTAFLLLPFAIGRVASYRTYRAYYLIQLGLLFINVMIFLNIFVKIY